MSTRSHGSELVPGLAPRVAPLLRRRLEGLGERTPADLTFGNLWLFRREHRWRWHDGPWPCISGATYDGQRLALPLFDVRAAPPEVTRALVAEHGGLFPLCEREAAAARATGLALTHNRDDADYVYPAEHFRTYKGPSLKKKANLMAQLLARHRIDAEPYGQNLQEAGLQILDRWMQDKDRMPGDADETACREALSLASDLQLRGFLYRADGEPAGFILVESLQDGVWAVRFAKGLVRFKGISQYMFHHFACSGDGGEGPAVNWLNFEQDLGLPNFRRTKTSYRPAFLLPKWRLLPSPA